MFFLYYSHITRTTQWEDPRKQQLAAQQAAQQIAQHQSAESLIAAQNIQHPTGKILLFILYTISRPISH